MKVNKILVSQPRPAVVEKSPFYELSQKYKIEVDYTPLIKVVGVSSKEFRSQRVDILSHTAVIFTSRTTIDSFFRICEESRVTVPETMKYICTTEAIALYLQKYIVYRKRKISFADGSFNGLIELLKTLKINFSPVILARTVAADLEGVDINSYDMLLLYSPWDVMSIAEKGDIASLPAIATFGQGTLRKAVETGMTVKVAAPTPEAPSLAKAVDIYCARIAKGEDVAPVVVEEKDNGDFIRSQQNKLAKKSRSRSVSAGDRK